MKNCSNCGTANPLQLSTCPKCKITIDVLDELVVVPEQTPIITKRIKNCVNCGNSTSATLDKCQSCHFPIPKTIENLQSLSATSTLRLLEKSA